MRPRGRFDVGVRERFSVETGARRERLEQQLSGRLGRTEVLEVTTSDVDDLATPVEVKAEVAIEKLGKSAGAGELRIPVSIDPRKLLASASEAKRSYDLLLGVPERDDLQLVVRLPEGLEVASAPADEDKASAFGTYSIHTEVAGRELRIRSSSTIEKARVAAGEYAEFRQFARDLDEAQAREIVLRSRP